MPEGRDREGEESGIFIRLDSRPPIPFIPSISGAGMHRGAIFLPLLFLVSCARREDASTAVPDVRARAERGWLRDASDLARADLPLPSCLMAGSSGAPVINRELGVPDTLADRAGWIVAVESDTISILPDPCATAAEPMEIVVPSRALVMRRVGDRMNADQLRAGYRVSVWLASARAGSDARDTASAVVIERMAEPRESWRRKRPLP